MSGALRDLSKEPLPTELTTDVLIVGSGVSGATAARVLAAAGRQVIVLEEGGDFIDEKLTQRDAQMYDQLYIDRGGRSTSDLSISVLQGRVLGGGAVINASDVVPLRDEILEFWQRRHGLSDWSARTIEPYRQKALEDLRAKRIRDDEVNRANELLRIGAEKLSLRGEVMLHNRENCQGLGTCLIGCPLGRKMNPRMVSIPMAVESGAVFLCRARAVRIDDGRDEIKRVTVKVLDEKGYHETGSFLIRARTVILAANAVGSAQLLLRSGVGSSHVGLNVSLQPQLPIVAIFDEDVVARRGIPQSYAITEGERIDETRGLWGFRIEGIFGTPGIVASLQPGVGSAVLDLMRLYDKIAASLILVPDEPSGAVGLLSSGRPRIDYQHLDSHKLRLREGAKMAARAYLAAGAREVLLPLYRPLVMKSEQDIGRIDDIPFDACSAPLISAHQQGGLRAAHSDREGVCAPDGHVFGARGIYCFDSGLFPTSSSSHTQAPNITMARYLADRLLAETPT